MVGESKTFFSFGLKVCASKALMCLHLIKHTKPCGICTNMILYKYKVFINLVVFIMHESTSWGRYEGTRRFIS